MAAEWVSRYANSWGLDFCLRYGAPHRMKIQMVSSQHILNMKIACTRRRMVAYVCTGRENERNETSEEIKDLEWTKRNLQKHTNTHTMFRVAVVSHEMGWIVVVTMQ